MLQARRGRREPFAGSPAALVRIAVDHPITERSGCPGLGTDNLRSRPSGPGVASTQSSELSAGVPRPGHAVSLVLSLGEQRKDTWFSGIYGHFHQQFKDIGNTANEWRAGESRTKTNLASRRFDSDPDNDSDSDFNAGFPLSLLSSWPTRCPDMAGQRPSTPRARGSSSAFRPGACRRSGRRTGSASCPSSARRR
jgi:hypothetical protein